MPDDNGLTDLSIADRADEGEAEVELFPVGSLDGDSIAPQKLIKRGLPVEITVSIGKAEVPVRGEGLLDPEKSGRSLVSWAFLKNEEVPSYDSEGRINGWKVRQHLRATFVKQANDEVPLIRSEFEALLAIDAPQAGKLLDELKVMVEGAMTSSER